ncbi:hypothetical protein B0H10DRAFT_1788337 [Mycena sp. CBHHK59/15]|nr:hypothetical protein B0H10DRAFT_1788337 [Mycena sp. CBHHK59/15]
MEARSRGAFWSEIKCLADPKVPPISVTASSIKEVFEKRLKPPETLPSQFDAAQNKINKILADLLPETTEDTTPEGFFSRTWTEEDTYSMGRLKDYLRKHSLNSSPGEDQTIYAELLEIPNENLIRLLTKHITLGESCYIIIGLHKLNGNKNSFYRLKTFTNGKGWSLRINNNPFILRCLKDWATACSCTLYVATVDATNAFPSTDWPILWLKLFRMGMSGTMFDWLCMLYEKLEYYVKHSDMES